jgi:hypothetical protein
MDDSNHTIIENALKDFPWGNYGLDEVDIGLADDPEAQEWVKDLAADIWHDLFRAERLK